MPPASDPPPPTPAALPPADRAAADAGAEQARAERAHLDAVLEQLPVGVIIAAAPEGRIVASNARVVDIFGYEAPASEIARYSADWRGYHPDGRPYASDEYPMARAIRRGETTAGERIVFERPDGGRVTTEINAAPVRDAAGAVVAGVVVIEDVTARVAADEVLRASEERYVLAARATSNAIWDWDLTTNVVRWNPGVYEVFGYPAGSVEETAAWWYDHIHPEDRDRVVGAIHAVIDDPAAGTAWRDEYRFRRGDGSYALVIDRGHVARDAPGRGARMIGAMADVTAEREAAGRAARLQRVTAALAAPLARPQVAEVFAGALAEAFGAAYVWLAAVSRDGRWFEVLAVREEAGVVAGAHDPLPTDSPTVVAAVRADGRPRVFGSRAALLAEHPQLAGMLPPGHEGALALPLRTDGGVLAVAWLAFAEPRDFAPEELAFAEALAAQCAQALDRARLYEAERALRAEAERERAEAEAARREAERASRAKGEFLATMSHELRTPINAITGYAQLLDLEVAGPVTPEQRDYLTRLTASGKHLLGLVDDVLDLAKLDAGRVAVAREALPASGAAAAALSVVLPLAEAKRVRLVDAMGDAAVAGRARYVGDEHRVRQVLINLLSNAVKFTPAGGTVELACAVAPEAASAARVEGGGPWLAFAVRDTGVGIAPERQAAVFEPFVQAEAGHTRAHGGTGLGLTISRRLARLMGGDLTLESAPGAGATFTLWLPALAEPAPEVTGAWPVPAAPGATPAGDADPPEGARSEGAEREGADARGARARREVTGFRVHGLREVSDHLREHLEEVLERYVTRLRGDPVAAPAARDRTRADLEDHALSFVADLVQGLGVLEGGAEAERLLLQDSADVQRLLAERHGRQRHRLGFTAEQLARDYVVMGQELAAVVRQRVPPHVGDVTAALATLDRLVRRAAEHAQRGYRRAASESTGEHAAVGGTRAPRRSGA